jgi:hypothetical protein
MLRRAALTVLASGWICSVLVQPASGQSREERVASLAQNAVPIRSIEPADEDFADLAALETCWDPRALSCWESSRTVTELLS